MEKDDDIILIDDGDVFHGTCNQFRDCFFSNASDLNIIEWCEQNNLSLKINKIIVICKK